MSQKIVFTGGGTAGHVTPNLALIEAAQKEGWAVEYIGSNKSIEQGMIKAINIPFYSIRSGKLRRYFSWKNFVDPFNILLGIGQSWRLLREMRPNIVFSKGGFVAFPVVFAAWLRRIPIVAHESDMSPGLANRLSFPFVTKICLTFAAAKSHFKNQQRIEITGTPIRQQLFQGDREQGLRICGFEPTKPCVLVMGGSQGASLLNQAVREALPQLTQTFQVIHLCGKGKLDETLSKSPSYVQLEYADKELPDLLAAADLIISRSGANSLYEILALQKPHILIPLSARVSRGDQIQNARYFSKQNISKVIDEESLTAESLLNAVNDVQLHRVDIIEKIKALNIESATPHIMQIIKATASGS
jgi:UDP-N-acetylglucosamine--N-acetylmuramyl-(pentapeptide) pyrophosphoryl-undecaprenol N-acetylglucosamine transferase